MPVRGSWPGRMLALLLALLPGLLPVPLPVRAAAAPAAGQPAGGDPECCRGMDAAAARMALEEGVRLFFSGGRRADAAEPLCRVVCCGPPPDAEVEIDAVLVQTGYFPFYWRGRLYLESRPPDVCRGLRYLNLSLCEGEAASRLARERYGLAVERKAAAARRGRPPTPGAYVDGVAAFEAGRWRQAALLMVEALAAWDEDGEGQRVQGRWFDTYLPRYHLGRALLELGCPRAVAVLACSEVSWCQLRDGVGDPARLVETAAGGEGGGEACAAVWRRAAELKVELDGCCACAGC